MDLGTELRRAQRQAVHDRQMADIRTDHERRMARMAPLQNAFAPLLADQTVPPRRRRHLPKRPAASIAVQTRRRLPPTPHHGLRVPNNSPASSASSSRSSSPASSRPGSRRPSPPASPPPGGPGGPGGPNAAALQASYRRGFRLGAWTVRDELANRLAPRAARRARSNASRAPSSGQSSRRSSPSPPPRPIRPAPRRGARI